MAFDPFEEARKKRQKAKEQEAIDQAEWVLFGADSKLGRQRAKEIEDEAKRRKKMSDLAEQAWQRTQANNAQEGAKSFGILGGAQGSKLAGVVGNLPGGQEMLAKAGAGLGRAHPALELAQLGADKIKEVFEGATKSAKKFGDIMSGIARNEFPDIKKEMREVADSFADSVPIIGGMIKAEMQFTREITDIPKKIKDGLLQRGNELGGLSGSVAVAQARDSVRRFQSDFKEANELGGGYGRLIDAQSRIDDSLKQILLPIKKSMLEKIVPAVELGATGIGWVADIVNGLFQRNEQMAKEIGELVQTLIKLAPFGEKALDELKRWREQQKEKMPPDPLDAFYRSLDKSIGLQ
jgi:methyl-accepting chemotaxis protein